MARLRTAWSRLTAYQRRHGAWRTLRRALLGPQPEPPTPAVDALPDLAPGPTPEPAPVEAAPEPAPVDAAPVPPDPAPEPEPELAPEPAPPAPPPRPRWKPLHAFHTPARGRKRITALVDSMEAADGPGGIGNTVLLGCLLARQGGADLRLVTRIQPPQPVILHTLLQAVGVSIDGDIQCRFLPAQDVKADLDLMDGEVLVTDAWWNALAALGAVEPARVVCLLQADPRSGLADDEQLLCEQLLQRRDLHWVLGTVALQQQLVLEGFDHFATLAPGFDPASSPAALQAVLALLARQPKEA